MRRSALPSDSSTADTASRRRSCPFERRLFALLPILTAACWAQPGAVHFKRMAEPKEGAFTLLAPVGWRASGGIVRVNAATAGGPLNAIAAKLDFTLSSPDGGISLRWYPETMFVDMRRMPAAAMFPVGSNYNGAMVLPLLNAFGYLEQGFRHIHPRAAGLTVKGRYPLPGVADSYAAVARFMRVPIPARFDAGLLVVEYQDDGVAWEEALYTAVQDFGDAGAGLWCNKDTFSVRAPAGGLAKTGRIVSIVLNSVQLNPRWVQGEIQGQIRRSEIAIRTQEEIARLDREIVEHRRRTNAEINNQMFHNLMGTEEYVNPISKKVEVGSNAWNYRWVNEHGEAVYSDDPNYDPKRSGLEGFQRSPVRKRFPDK
ncbi:MAG: hypothetical protein KIT09_14290 [Bryobacteraceae bacterium]|nr:hypothetical protein [Bryobacteraceae bacterium]